MKKALLIAFAAASLLLVSCTTTQPLQATNSFPAGENYKILGRVTLKASSSRSGYIKLLEAAQKKFPECDDIVNIMIDSRNDDVVMTAIAIDYTDF